MLYTLERSVVNPNEPTLAQMTDKAIKILKQGSKGYFLLVEGMESFYFGCWQLQWVMTFNPQYKSCGFQ